MKFNRNIEELEKHAILWWPKKLTGTVNENIIPTLLRTQDDFLKILSLSKNNPFQVFKVIQAARFPVNLFLKHLCILANYGGEPIQRLNRSFSEILPKEKGKYKFLFTWGGKEYEYLFKALPIKGLGNSKLKIDGKGLIQEINEISPLYKDMVLLLMFGSSSNINESAGLSACDIGTILGNDDALKQYVKQRYIIVSRITGGATANSLGQLAQKYAIDILKRELGNDYSVLSNKKIILKGYDNVNGMPFDIAVRKGRKIIGIEISFQVTTNSTIERKSGQAANRRRLMHNNGYHIAYIIDGAGNFQRSSAISIICDNSECTVAFRASELAVLSEWIKSLDD